MIYLTGVTNDRDEPGLIAAGVGLMAQPGNSYHLRIDRYPWWAADNGCFGGRWDEDRWIRWLEELPRDRCLFAVAPDVYPHALATIERSLPYLPILRDLGYPAALVAQDGAESARIPWEELDCLFLGGEAQKDPRREWKLRAGAKALAREARRRGKWVHMGRVNSVLRLERAREMGCLSADGTALKYRRRLRAGELGLPADRGGHELGAWVGYLERNPILWRHEQPAHPTHREAAP